MSTKDNNNHPLLDDESLPPVDWDPAADADEGWTRVVSLMNNAARVVAYGYYCVCRVECPPFYFINLGVNALTTSIVLQAVHVRDKGLASKLRKRNRRGKSKPIVRMN